MKSAFIASLTVGAFAALPTSAIADSVDANAPTNAPWTRQRFQREFCGEDIWEPFNRTMFGIFDFGMTYVVDPFCYLYSSIVPKPLIQGIDNFGENLESPCRICSNLFMGEWLPAWDSTRRCVINTTLGIGGLFDPAADWFCIYDTEASLSDTFAAWGIPAGPPLALPFLPNASIRGHVGYVLDYALDVKTWFDYLVPSGIFLGWSWCLTPNKAPVWRGLWETMFYHADDDYAIYMPVAAAASDFNLRQFTWRYREALYDRAYMRLMAKEMPEGSDARMAMEAEAESFVEDVRPPIHPSATRPEGLKGEWREIPGYAPRGPSLDSLRALCFTPLGDDDFWWERRSIFNRDFSKSIDEREIVIRDDLPKATYSFVAPSTTTRQLVVILPGLGSGRTANEAVALAEFLHANGYGVVICDSLFHPEHAQSVNRGILPGYISEDVKRYADFLWRILYDIERNDLIVTADNEKPATRNAELEVSIIGWSMGGLTTVHFAALDERGELPIAVKRFVAINPPASMDHALAPFEAVVEASRGWTKEQSHAFFTKITPTLFGWAALDHPRYDPANPPMDAIGDPWDYAPNLSEEQANFLLGQTLRVIFPSLIAQRHRLAPFPWVKSELTWFHRNDFYAEIGDMTMREYITKYVPYCYDGVTAETMVATASIRRLGDALKRNAKLTVIHTWNDPLETDDDRRYFDQLFGQRITWFADGGHCGYFYTKPFQDELLRRLTE